MSMSRWIACTVVVLVAGLPAAAGESDGIARAKARVAKAEVQLQKGQYVEAEKMFNKAIEMEPTLPSAHLGLGAALVGQRRYDEALHALTEAERRYEEFDLLQRESGRLAVAGMAETERQVETLKDTYGVFQRGPSNQQLTPAQVSRMNVPTGSSMPAHAFFLQGVALLRTDQMVEGIERLERCVSIDGNHGLAHHNLAVATYSMGRVDEAKSHLDAAIAAGVEPPPTLVAEIEARARERALADASEGVTDDSER
jgi:tetratricopeptide (TPR) repeat protein